MNVEDIVRGLMAKLRTGEIDFNEYQRRFNEMIRGVQQGEITPANPAPPPSITPNPNPISLPKTPQEIMKELQEQWDRINKDHPDSHHSYGTQAPDVKGGPPTVDPEVQKLLDEFNKVQDQKVKDYLDQQKKAQDEAQKGLTGLAKCNTGDFWEDFKCGFKEGLTWAPNTVINSAGDVANNALNTVESTILKSPIVLAIIALLVINILKK